MNSIVKFFSSSSSSWSVDIRLTSAYHAFWISTWRPGPLIKVVEVETRVEWEADNSTNFLLCLPKPDWLLLFCRATILCIFLTYHLSRFVSLDRRDWKCNTLKKITKQKLYNRHGWWFTKTFIVNCYRKSFNRFFDTRCQWLNRNIWRRIWSYNVKF